MTKADEVRKYLKEEFGINNDAEFEKAYKEMKPLNLWIFCGGREILEKKDKVDEHR